MKVKRQLTRDEVTVTKIATDELVKQEVKVRTAQEVFKLAHNGRFPRTLKSVIATSASPRGYKEFGINIKSYIRRFAVSNANHIMTIKVSKEFEMKNLPEKPPIDEEEFERLADFIFESRQKERDYWWIGIAETDVDEPSLISTTLRLAFDSKLLLPIPDEVGGECCKRLMDRMDEISDTTDPNFDPFIFLNHCATREHVQQMLLGRSQEALEREYQYMLKVIMQSLHDLGGDDDE